MLAHLVLAVAQHLDSARIRVAAPPVHHARKREERIVSQRVCIVSDDGDQVVPVGREPRGVALSKARRGLQNVAVVEMVVVVEPRAKVGFLRLPSTSPYGTRPPHVVSYARDAGVAATDFTRTSR